MSPIYRNLTTGSRVGCAVTSWLKRGKQHNVKDNRVRTNDLQLETSANEHSGLSDCYAGSGLDITAVTKLKHADLWAAAKKMGSQSALARHLAIPASELGEWINLKRCPPREPVGKRWTEEYLAKIEGKLLALTGKDWDELFPADLRDNAEFLDCEKTIEKTARVKDWAMWNYAVATRERLERIAHDDSADDEQRKHEVNLAMANLDTRERKVIELRYGLDGSAPLTLRECGHTLLVSVERVRQIEKNAFKKMKVSQEA